MTRPTFFPKDLVTISKLKRKLKCTVPPEGGTNRIFTEMYLWKNLLTSWTVELKNSKIQVYCFLWRKVSAIFFWGSKFEDAAWEFFFLTFCSSIIMLVLMIYYRYHNILFFRTKMLSYRLFWRQIRWNIHVANICWIWQYSRNWICYSVVPPFLRVWQSKSSRR